MSLGRWRLFHLEPLFANLLENPIGFSESWIEVLRVHHVHELVLNEVRLLAGWD